MNLERETSRVTSSLENRISANSSFGSADLSTWLLERLPLESGTRLLDLGCGTANHLLRMAGAGALCTGVDVSSTSLAAAVHAAERAQVEIRFIQADMDNLPKISEKFDLITSMYALYYARDALAVLDRLMSMLSPNGTIAIFGPYDDNNREWFEFIDPFVKLDARILHSTTNFMYSEVLPFALQNFAVVSCERFVNRVSFPSQDELRRYWRSNIYYRESADPAFEQASSTHFGNNETFGVRKVGLSITMQKRFKI